MSKRENNEGENPVQTTQLLRAPGQGEVATGFSAQGRPEDMQRVAKVNYRILVNKNIADQLGVFNKLKAVKSEAEAAYNEAVDNYTVPKDFISDLEKLHAALGKFFKEVPLPKVPAGDGDEDDASAEDNGQQIKCTVLRDSRKMQVSAHFSKLGNSYADGGMTVRREYAWPEKFTTLRAAVDKAAKDCDAAETKLASLRGALSRIEEVGEEAAAVVAAHNLSQCGSLGNSLLGALDELFARRAAADGLSVDSSTPPPSRLALSSGGR